MSGDALLARETVVFHDGAHLGALVTFAHERRQPLAAKALAGGANVERLEQARLALPVVADHDVETG